MAAPYNPPKSGEDFQIRIALQDLGVPASFKANPTIALGDFKVDIDGGGFNNLNTTPSVSPTGGIAVLLTLSAAEMTGAVISIQGIDQSTPKEWADFFLSIPTT